MNLFYLPLQCFTAITPLMEYNQRNKISDLKCWHVTLYEKLQGWKHCVTMVVQSFFFSKESRIVSRIQISSPLKKCVCAFEKILSLLKCHIPIPTLLSEFVQFKLSGAHHVSASPNVHPETPASAFILPSTIINGYHAQIPRTEWQDTALQTLTEFHHSKHQQNTQRPPSSHLVVQKVNM